MRSLLRAGALALLIGGVAAGATFARPAARDMVPQDEMGAAAGASGFFAGTPGGSFATWPVDLPAGKNVTLKLGHWPCNTGTAVGLNVWGASGRLAASHQADACTQTATFNTGNGGKAEIQAYNYLRGLPVWYSLTADGMTLPGTMAPAATASTTGATTTMPATTAATADVLNIQNQTLFGNAGGAANRHDLMVKEGQTTTVKMSYGTDMGGTWPAIGLKVWGPDGWVASSHPTGLGTAEATFMSPGNVKYIVEVYNYHSGVTAFYGLQAMTSEGDS